MTKEEIIPINVTVKFTRTFALTDSQIYVSRLWLSFSCTAFITFEVKLQKNGWEVLLAGAGTSSNSDSQSG